MRTIVSLLLTFSVAACTQDGPTAASRALSFSAVGWPASIELPDGYWPEGIAAGPGTTFFVGSIATGGIFRADARTGAGQLLAAAYPGGLAGLKYDARGDRIFAAAGSNAVVFDASTGAVLAEYALGAFINDLTITHDAVYFTDSFLPQLYRLPLGAAGALPDVSAIETIPLNGATDWVDGNFNANGIISTPDGRHLIVVNTTTGALYRVDARTGATTFVDLGSASLVDGDGMLLRGNDLYVVLGPANEIAVVRMDAAFTRGIVTRSITSPLLRFPSTIAFVGDAIHAVNARFDVEPGPDVEYEVVRLPR